MKGKLIAFLLPVVYVFTLLLVVSPSSVSAQTSEVSEENEKWEVSSVCTAACGTTEGKQTETLYKKVCEKACPSVPFSASEEYLVEEGYYLNCPKHYSVDSEDESKCVKTEKKYARHIGWGVCPINDSSYTLDHSPYPGACERRVVVDVKDRGYVDPVYETRTFGPISVRYLLNSEVDVCSRPSADDVVFRAEWAKSFYNSEMPLTMDLVDTETCEFVATETTREVDCEAELVACPVDDEGEVQGVTDEVEVKGTTDVVLADTGASDNTLVYLVEGILVLGTLVSSAMFVKKYAI